MNLSNITIIIPTFNRPNILNRNLEFLNSFNFNLKVLILDSSKKKNTIIKKKFPNLLINYKKYSEDISFAKKIFFGIKIIKTKFLVINADDDFINPNCINLCMEFLEKNIDFSACQGSFYQHAKSNKIYKKINFSFLYKNNKSSEHESYFERCNSYLQGKKSNFFYSVIRTSIACKVWRFISSFDGVVLEIMNSFLINFYGKTKVLNNFYLSRDASNSMVFINKKFYNKFLSKRNINYIFHNLNRFLKKKKISKKKLLIFKKNIQIIKRKKTLTKDNNILKVILYIIFNKIFTIFRLNFLDRDICLVKKIEHYFLKHYTFINEIRSSKKLQKILT